MTEPRVAEHMQDACQEDDPPMYFHEAVQTAANAALVRTHEAIGIALILGQHDPPDDLLDENSAAAISALLTASRHLAFLIDHTKKPIAKKEASA